jgi:hypothetical protein
LVDASDIELTAADGKEDKLERPLSFRSDRGMLWAVGMMEYEVQ